MPSVGEGEVLARVVALSVDPTNRVWMREEDSYLPAVELGAVVRAAGLARVVESRREGFRLGDLVMGMPGWQDYWLLGAGDLATVVPAGLDPVEMLSIYGGTGMTAWFGVEDVCELRTGDTFVVSGAAGAVGSVAGQAALDQGRRAGRRYRRDAGEVPLGGRRARLRRVHRLPGRGRIGSPGRAVPDGVDVYFDNVGGEILDAVLGNLAIGAGSCAAARSRRTTRTSPPGSATRRTSSCSGRGCRDS